MPTKSPSRKRPSINQVVETFPSPEMRMAFYGGLCKRIAQHLVEIYPGLPEELAVGGWRDVLPKYCATLLFTVEELGIKLEGQPLFFRGTFPSGQHCEVYFVDLVDSIESIGAAREGLSQDNPPTSHESPAASRPLKAKAKPSPAPRSAADVAESVPIDISISDCDPHPKNIKPLPTEVAEIKASFDEEGQLEPIDVRPLANGRYQILSGETRWTAAKQLNWTHIKARIRECDDHQALKYLAIFNSKRKVLDPIRKAVMIKHLTDDGMTLLEAGKIYGFEHAGSAGNLTRLLRLPQVWQDRIVAGELPESFARLLVPYVGIASVMAALDKNFREEQAAIAKGKVDGTLDWDSRTNVATLVERTLDEHLRPIDKQTKFDYGHRELHGITPWYRYSGEYARLFELTPEIEAKLAIVEVEIDGKLGRWATNAKAYDKLQIPLIKQRVDDQEKTKAAKQAAKNRPADVDKSKPLTKAQLAERKRKAAEQLQAGIQAWRHKVLRENIASDIAGHPDVAWRLVLAVACHRPSGISLAEMLAHARDAKQQHALTWREVADVRSVPSAVAEIAKQILAAESRDKRWPHLPWAFVDDLAAALAIDIASVWRNLQLATKSPLFEAFFQLHNSDQLDALGDELGVHVREAKTRAIKIKLLTGTSRTLKLPKSIAPLKAAKLPAKKGGRA